MSHPRAVEALTALAILVFPDFRKRALRYLGVLAVGNECSHTADCMCASLVANAYQAFRVGAHERHRHSHMCAVRQHKGAVMREFLDDAEDVVPAPRIETCRVIAQLVQDLLHLEGGEGRLDENRRADRPARHREGVLCEVEYIVPQPRLEMALHLRQIEIRAATAADQLLRIVEEV